MFKAILILLVNCLLANSEENIKSLTSSNANLEVIAFRKLGSYRGFNDDSVEYHKTYYLSRNIWTSWAEALSFCKSYNLELLTLETATEAEAYLNLLETNAFLRSQVNVWIYVDGFAMTPGSRTDWYWTTTGKKVSFPIRWHMNYPMNRSCLALYKPSINERFYFYDDTCTCTAGAACQKINILTPQSEKQAFQR